MTLSQRQRGGVGAALRALSEECDGAAFTLAQTSRLVPSQSHCHVAFHTQIAQKSAKKAHLIPTLHYNDDGWPKWVIIELSITYRCLHLTDTAPFLHLHVNALNLFSPCWCILFGGASRWTEAKFPRKQMA